MPLKSERKLNPYGRGDLYDAWQRGYSSGGQDAIRNGVTNRAKDEMIEGFIRSLLEVVQEYGGDRFIYTASNQDDLEEFLGNLDVGVDTVSEALSMLNALSSSIRTIR